ncbi:MAG: hypothetical protein U0K23_07515 [Selenomonadaceae bacterium]|nr:hypothetical protein [Selenomonadaceae bacterium]
MINFNDIYNHLENGRLLEADILALEAFKSDNQKERAIELLISIAIEAGDIDLAKERLRFLDDILISSYRLFLRARVAFMEKNYWQALTYLEQAVDNTWFQYANNQIKEKIYNLLGQCYRFYGYPNRAAECYYKAYKTVDNKQLKILEYSNYLFNLHYLYITPKDYFNAHREYNKLFSDVKKFKHTKKENKRKIRIGYISPDFRNHVVLRFSIAYLISYNREKFEVYCYSTGKEDNYSNFIKTKVTKWCNLQGVNFKTIACKIYNDGVDILFDLCGHCNGSNLPVLAYKPAPIQICGIGYFATTGLKAVDYFLTDDFLKPKQKFFTEKILSLPKSHFCYVPLGEIPALQDAPCLKKGYITFGSFNNVTKVTDEVLDVWKKIMDDVPNSHLLLKGSLFDNIEGRQLFLQRLENIGFDLIHIELRGITNNYLSEYLDMDIALDTFPYPGGGTTCDALYMGVPVITLLDGSHGGDFGGSILKNIGLDFACTLSKEEYIQRARSFAEDKELLNALHRGLRNMMLNSHLMDQKQYMADYEEALIHIYNDEMM